MSDNGISLHAISVQNEPDYGEEGGWTEWSSEEMVNFIKYGRYITSSSLSLNLKPRVYLMLLKGKEGTERRKLLVER